MVLYVMAAESTLPNYKVFIMFIGGIGFQFGEVCFAEGRSCTTRAIISTMQGPRLVFAKMFLKVIIGGAFQAKRI